MKVNLSPQIDIINFSSLLDSLIKTLQRERWSGIIKGGKVNLGLIELKIPNNLVIVGDLHGDLDTLKEILEEINYKKFLSNGNNKLIFLGDYVDRGSHSIEVLFSVSYLKQSFPDSVILMRGNHEAPIEFPFASHDLPIKIAETFGQSKNIIHKKILRLFKLLTLTVIIERKILLVHGGLPVITNKNYKESISGASQNHNKDILEELLWNDPRAIDDWEISRRRFGKHFGKSVTMKWLKLTNTCAVVRSHEPCHGFKIDHDKMVFTVFSCKESYQDFESGYLYLTNNQLQEISNGRDLVQHIRKIRG